MSTPSTSEKSATIADRGYQPYRGGYTELSTRWMLVCKRSLSSALKQRWILILMVAALLVAAVAAVLTYLQSAVIPSAAVTALKSYTAPGIVSYSVATSSFGTLLLTLFIAIYCGGSAIAEDVRSGAFQFYFSRPLSRDQYLVGKLVPAVILLLSVSFVPTFLVALMRASLAKTIDEMTSLVYLPIGAIAFGVSQAIVYGLVSVALSSLARSRSYAQATVAGALFLPWILGRVIAPITRSYLPKLLSLPDLFDALAHALFRVPSGLSDRILPIWLTIPTLLAISASATVLLRAQIAEKERTT